MEEPVYAFVRRRLVQAVVTVFVVSVAVFLLNARSAPHVVGSDVLESFEALARAGDWEGFTVSFFRDTLSVPAEVLDELRTTPLWPPMIADAKASLGDLRALSRYDFRPEHFQDLRFPPSDRHREPASSLRH